MLEMQRSLSLEDGPSFYILRLYMYDFWLGGSGIELAIRVFHNERSDERNGDFVDFIVVVQYFYI